MHRLKILLPVIFLFTSTVALSQKVALESIDKNVNKPVGGLKEVKEMIFLEMMYPLEDIKQQNDGDVVISYILPPDGKPKEIKVENSPSETLGNEGMRLFKKIRFPENEVRSNWSTSREKMIFTFSRKSWVKVYTKRGYQEILYPHEPIDSTETLYPFQSLEDKPYPLFEKNENYRDYLHFISSKLEYPEEALKLGIKGQVIISFVVEQSGNISNVEVVQSLPAGCTEEALRLIHLLKWYPARVEDVAVRTYMISSIGFGASSSSYHDVFNQGTSGR